MNPAPTTASSGGVLICFAVKEELKPFLGTAAFLRATILITGMGAQNADRELRKLLTTLQPRLILTCGFAGGLNPTLPAGAVLFSGDENNLTQNLLAAGATPATFFCAKRVAITANEKSELHSLTKADAVEMESGVIRRIAQERGIPSATIRVISDAANEDLPLDFNSLMTPQSEIDLSKLILNLLLKPWKMPALLRLQKKTRNAAENLSRVLDSLPI